MRVDYQTILDEENSPLVRTKVKPTSSPPRWSERFGSISATPKTVAFAGAICGLFVIFGALPESATAFLPSFLVGSRGGANTIEICAKEMDLVTTQPARNALVRCFDKDTNSDDLMTEGRTGSDGCARLRYANKSWDGIGGGHPDIYCTVIKGGFTVSTPADKDGHNPKNLAKFPDVTLYRDRRNDYGHDNGCGPDWAEKFGLNAGASFLLRFGDQCTMHDKCYFDCQIFTAKGGNAANAQKFCDDEMYAGMVSMCHGNRGKLHGFGEDACLARASSVYAALRSSTLNTAYDKTVEKCEDIPSNERNDYDRPACFHNGFQCGFDGSTHDNLQKCNECCDGPRAKHGGAVWDDYYCKCLPRGTKCGSTLITNKYNNCNSCCSQRHTVDDGWSFDDYHCQ